MTWGDAAGGGAGGSGGSPRPSAAGSAHPDFGELYPALFLPAMRLAYRVTGDRALSEDLAAEALARAYARWSTVSSCASPTAWVLRVTTNLAIDAGRRRRLSVQALPHLCAPEGVGDFSDLVASRVALAAALSALPRRQREAIALRYLAELSEDEVSRTLDIAPSSVRTHVQRGLESLRRALGPLPEVRRVAV